MVVGISWGNTLYHVVKYIAANNHKNIPITVVLIMGAAGINSPERDSLDLLKDLASAYGGKYQYIYAPLFVKSKDIKESLIQDDNIKNALALAKNADVNLTSVGSIVYKSWSNYLSEKTLADLEQKGVVGHIGGHFFDIWGREPICIALGGKKAEAVAGAARKEDQAKRAVLIALRQ